MPKGTYDIPALRLVTLNKLVRREFQIAPGYFQSMFPTVNYPSDSIEWESIVGNLGLTPLVSPGAVAPTLAPSGVGEHKAKVAYWKEKMFMDEEFLNNLRQPGSVATYETAEMKLARELFKMSNRSNRRREWMLAKMIIEDGFNYRTDGGTQFEIDYGRPAEHEVTLTADDRWSAGASPDILKDVMDAKEAISDATDSQVTHCFFNQATLRTMWADSTVRSLAQKNAFGDGSFLTQPVMVLGQMFGIPNMVLMDAKYKVYAWITAISDTVITVDDIADFEAGGTLRLTNMLNGTYEDITISSVDYLNSQITVSSSPTATYVAGRDRVTMTKKFIDDDSIVFMTDRVDGQLIAEFAQSPFDLDRTWGQKVDRKEEWDPAGLWIRVQDKGLPINYFRDATYKLIHY